MSAFRGVLCRVVCAFVLMTTKAAATSTTLVASSAKDLVLSGGAQVTANPLNNVRSGNPQQHTAATFAIPLTVGASISSVSFAYRYMTGFGTWREREDPTLRCTQGYCCCCGVACAAKPALKEAAVPLPPSLSMMRVFYQYIQ